MRSPARLAEQVAHDDAINNKPTPQKTRRSNDGRDRKKAKVVDRYNTKKKGEGRKKEQQAMDERGGKEKLDNKRDEIAPDKREQMGLDPK